ncbi:SMP-30/gluconolactonase/LRE family protein [Alteromonas stellipolaris]|uniref:SMP-30/gluconolactonase/LRE family protein n=1 Tax=Alteromonas stellipolaris TaxID=233316 RepID=A0AAW7YV36_9ALTE|nr:MULTISPECIES: SMP-30/gluconolactonase/LRE family protein [Alteromonas]AMJ90925.1 strictosidine synthase [Alteromonas sp. Mac2]AMJ87064.1 strictosidine synthase [Alteromonas sp. Mac1]ANB22276.1 strictosidine synthase [Alteromonas stellipolaris]MDO6539518.1 SMP-30/gluconolactonase/LRE family protein [Alteromonas stellipolaris]MDO6576235.1 SMP-30/gluconolactonase/LRE family protein [Alteromonas stellipolaris]
MRIILIIALLSVTGYLLFWPVPVEPVAWDAPEDSGYSGVHLTNDSLSLFDSLSLGNEFGPEDFALRSDGSIATATHSGAILLLAPNATHFTPWVNTGGRPLGLEFDANNNLIVADAFLGLLSVSPSGDITLLTDSVDGTAIVYADDVDVAKNGMIYFSDATTKFSAKAYGGTLSGSLLEILEHKGHGRLLAYNPDTQVTTVLMDGLIFANGVAISQNQQYVLINETGSYRVLRYFIAGPKLGLVEVFIDNLPGFPDNIATAPDGDYWVGFASPRSASLDDLSNSPFLRKVVQRLPASLRPKAKAYGHVIKINEQGKVTRDLQDPTGHYPLTTGVLETTDMLYISSLTAPHVAVINKANLPKGDDE